MTDYLFLPGVNGEGAETDYVTEQDTWEAHLRVAFTDWTNGDEMLFSQWDDTGSQEHFYVRKNDTGTLQLRYVDDVAGSHFINSTAAPSLAVDGEPLSLRIVFQINSGGGDYQLDFYERLNDDDPWTQIGSSVTNTTFTQTTTDEEWRIGGIRPTFNSQPPEAEFYYLTVWSDLTQTTKIIDVDLTDLTADELEAASFTDDEANTVTLVGDEWSYARIYTTHDILREAELLLTADDGNKGFSPKWADRSGKNHHGQLGSIAGGDTNDPLFKRYDGEQYVMFPGVGVNSLDLAQAAPVNITGDIEFEWDSVLRREPLVQREGILNKNDAYTIRFQNPDDASPGRAIEVAVTESAAYRSILLDGYVVPLNERIRHKVTMELDNGSNAEAKIYAWESGAWVLKDTGTRAQITAIDTPSGSIEIGTRDGAGAPTMMDLYSIQVRDGIDGTDAIDVHAADAAEPYATFTERANSATVTINRTATGLVSTVVDRDMFLLTTDDYFEVPDDDALDFADGEHMTLMAVGRGHDISAGAPIIVAKTGGVGPTDNGYRLDSSNTGQARLEMSDGTFQGVDLTSPADLVDNVLASIAGRRDDTALEVEAFADANGSGSPDGTNLGDTSTALDLVIGLLDGTYAEGQVTAVALWRSVLSDAEMQEAHDLLTAVSGGAATLVGVGVIAASGEAVSGGAATLVGVGVIAASGAAVASGAATLIGVGIVTASGEAVGGGAATLIGVGIVAASGEAVGAGPVYVDAAATLVGVGVVSVRAGFVLWPPPISRRSPRDDLAAAIRAVVDDRVSVSAHPTAMVSPPAVVIRPADPYQAPTVAAGHQAAAWAFEVDIIVARLDEDRGLAMIESGRQQITAALPAGWRWVDFGDIAEMEVGEKLYLRGTIGVATIYTEAR